MASNYLPQPGTQRGPCKDECKHLDCKETRIMATSVCRYCNEPIGYDRHFYSPFGTQELAHAACYEDAVLA